MTVLDVIFVVGLIVFLIVGYAYAIWQSWDEDRRRERIEDRETFRQVVFGDDWFDSGENVT